MSTMDYLEFKEHLEHAFTQKDKANSKKWYYIPNEKHKNGDDWLKTRYEDRDGHITYNRGSKAGMPTNLKQESSNIKRTSERAKFMNQLQQVCSSIKTLDEQLGQIGKTQLGLYERKEVSSPNGGKSLVTSLKSGANTANAELGKLRQQYGAKVAPLEKQLHNLLNAGKNSPLFTDAEKEKMRKWMQSGGTMSELAGIYNDIFGSVSHSNLEHASIAGVPSRLRSKMQDAIYKKTGYQSKGSYAGAPANAKKATADQNKAVANARFSASIKSAIEACNRDAAEAQSVYVEATTRINNIVSRSRGEVNSIIRSVNEYNENVRNIRNQTITKKSTFATVANGKLYQGVRDEQVAVDPNRQFISFSAGAQKISANKYVYKPKMLLIDSDPGTYKEV